MALDDNTTQPLPIYGDPDPDKTQPYQRPQQRPPQKRRRKKQGCGCMGCFGRTLIIGLLLLAILIFAGVVAASTLISSNLTGELQDGIDRLKNAQNRETFETTVITDRHGDVLWEIFGEGKRTNIPFSQIPDTLKAATVSVEDDGFWTNKGFDEPSLIAALISNLRNDGRPVGGSTITQQIVRHIAFDYEERVSVSYRRKLKEIFLAWRMTQDFTKEEILAMYLNEIYYGNLAYGIEAASRTYFDKPATDLTMGEAAFLAGLPQSPVGLDPFTNFEGAQQRQWIVLNLMVNDGVIDLPTAENAYLQPLVFAEQEVSLLAPHFAVYARQQVEALFGADQVANGGLTIQTSLDLGFQNSAETLAANRVATLSNNNVTNAALVALKPSTGEILAMVGSVDYHSETIDGATNVALSLQQPGSTIKPLTFAAALSPNPETGEPAWTPADIVWDVPVEYPQPNGSTYAPVNYDERFHGPVRLRAALANSYNIPAVLLLQDVGVEGFLNFAQQMGLASLNQDPSQYGLALTLGGSEVTPLEMASAYSVFANGGAKVPSTAILKVTKSDGTVLYEYEAPEPEAVLDPRVAHLISDFLDDDAAREPAMGPNNVLDLPFAAAAKTGTTNDFRDNWTIGYTPGIAVAVWTGNNDNSPMLDVTGLSGAAPLWSEFVQSIYANPALLGVLGSNGAQPPTEFVAPAGIERAQLCNLSTLDPNAESCDLSTQEWVLTVANQAPAPTPDPNFNEIEPAVVQALSAPFGAWVDGVPPEEDFCRVGEGKWPEGTRPRLFIAPPRNEESLASAYEWSQAAGWMILPRNGCTSDDTFPTPTPNWEATKSAWPSPTPDANAWPTQTPWPTPQWTPPPTENPAVQPTAASNWQPSPTPQAPAIVAPTNTPNWQPTATAAWQPSPTPWPTNTPRPAVVPPTAVPTIQAAQPSQPSAGIRQNGAYWQISSPTSGQRLTSDVQLMGSAEFNAQTQFYKIEIRKINGNDWTTIGDSHPNGVSNGWLENLPVRALVNSAEWGAGQYEIRLILIQQDSNYVGTPFVVRVELAAP